MTNSPPLQDQPISWILAILICLGALAFSYAANLDLDSFRPLTREDGWLENLSAIFLFFSSLLLIASAKMERNLAARCLLLLGSAALLFGAGEEISWGQRILDFDPPKQLARINTQGEFNLHNTPWLRNTILVNELPMLLCVVSLAAFFAGRSSLLGIRPPSPQLVFALLLVLMYGRNLQMYRWLSWNEILLLFSFLFCMFRGRKSFAFAAAVVLSASYAIRFVNYDTDAPTHWSEPHEFLACFVFLCYSIEILLARLGGPAPVLAKTADWRWHRGFGLVVAGSLGLVVVGLLGDRIRQAAVEDVLRRLDAAQQVVDSHFDIYFDASRRQLLYFKTPCASFDQRGSFFLHVYPRNADLLSSYRGRLGFENYDFQTPWRSEQTCAAVLDLPSYEIERIETGQFRYGPSWREAFSLPPDPANMKAS